MRRIALAFGLLLVGASTAHAANPEGARHARDADGLFWFVHLSDSHIGASLIEGPHAKEHLTFALNEAVTVIKPRFVWNTGDLNDGSGKIGVSGTGIPTSGQSQTQWDWYKEVWQSAGMTKGFYFDLPGNHDVYDDKGATFYLKNSLWGSTMKKTWMDFSVETKTGDYRFFGLNSTNDYFKPLSNCCPGFLDSQIKELDDFLAKNTGAKLVFVAAHHALTGNGSQPTANADKVRALLKVHKAFYLHGDMHQYEEYLDSDSIVVNQIASLGKNDLENIGVGVIDHDAFVYRATDVTKAWPLGILTTPPSEMLKNSGNNPYAYAVCKDRPDNPFRAVTFSFTPPKKVTVKVGSLPEVAMKPVRGTFDFAYPVWQAEVDTRSLVAASTNVTLHVEAEGGSNDHSIVAKFKAGPCEPLPDGEPPDAGPPPGDAGIEADSGVDSGPPADTGAGPAADPGEDGSGCGCRTTGAGSSAGAIPALALFAALALRQSTRRASSQTMGKSPVITSTSRT